MSESSSSPALLKTRISIFFGHFLGHFVHDVIPLSRVWIVSQIGSMLRIMSKNFIV